MRAVVGRQPVWMDENSEVAETAMLSMDRDGQEYRHRDKDMSQGLKCGGHDAPDGADPMGLKNNPDTDGAEQI